LRFRAVLDPSAVLAYADGSEHVGEVLREFADEEISFAIPVACLAEARAAAATGVAVRKLDVLVGLKFAIVLPLDSGDWASVGAAAGLLGGLGRACAALLVVHGQAGYVVTAEPEVYGEGVETIPV
jgi:hypothetical protein